MSDGTPELAHDVAVHVAFARPKYLSRDDVPADIVAAERQTLEAITRNEGKPEAALAKIVDGRLQGFYKTVALLDQPYAKDDKQSITQLIGKATISVLRPGRDRLRPAGDRAGCRPRRSGTGAALAAHRVQAVR